MQRNFSPQSRPPAAPQAESAPVLKPSAPLRTAPESVGSFWDMLGIRLVFLAVCIAAAYHFRPFSVSKTVGAGIGFLFGLCVILFEIGRAHV